MHSKGRHTGNTSRVSSMPYGQCIPGALWSEGPRCPTVRGSPMPYGQSNLLQVFRIQHSEQSTH